jgi:putative transposase
VANGRSSRHLLNILVQCRRDQKAAKRCCRKLLKGLIYVTRVIITDKIKSCGVAQREMLPDMEYLHYRYLNNHAENSH